MADKPRYVKTYFETGSQVELEKGLLNLFLEHWEELPDCYKGRAACVTINCATEDESSEGRSAINAIQLLDPETGTLQSPPYQDRMPAVIWSAMYDLLRQNQPVGFRYVNQQYYALQLELWVKVPETYHEQASFAGALG